MQIGTISNLWKFLLPICQNITSEHVSKYHWCTAKKVLPIHPAAHPLCSPSSTCALHTWPGQMTSQWESRLHGHPTQACTRQLGKKEAGSRGPAHLTHNRASSWVGLKADLSPEMPLHDSQQEVNKRGRSWSLIVLLDFYQDVLGLGVEHLVKSFKPIILTLYHWRINTQIP